MLGKVVVRVVFTAWVLFGSIPSAFISARVTGYDFSDLGGGFGFDTFALFVFIYVGLPVSIRLVVLPFSPIQILSRESDRERLAVEVRQPISDEMYAALLSGRVQVLKRLSRRLHIATWLALGGLILPLLNVFSFMVWDWSGSKKNWERDGKHDLAREEFEPGGGYVVILVVIFFLLLMGIILAGYVAGSTDPNVEVTVTSARFFLGLLLVVTPTYLISTWMLIFYLPSVPVFLRELNLQIHELLQAELRDLEREAESASELAKQDRYDEVFTALNSMPLRIIDFRSVCERMGRSGERELEHFELVVRRIGNIYWEAQEAQRQGIADYSLQRGRQLAGQAVQAYNSGDFDQSVDLNQQALELYDKALGVVGDDTVSRETISGARESLQVNLDHARRASSYRQLDQLVEQGNSHGAMGDNAFQVENYGDALSDYQSSVEVFNQALATAQSLQSQDHISSLSDALAQMGHNILSCRVKYGQSRVLEGQRTFDEGNPAVALEVFQEAETYFSELLPDLSAEVHKNDTEVLLTDARLGIVSCREEEAGQVVLNGNREFEEDRYIDAKVTYERAREILGEASNLAVRHDLRDARVRIERNLEVIGQNVTRCNEAVMQIEIVDSPDVPVRPPAFSDSSYQSYSVQRNMQRLRELRKSIEDRLGVM